jgi:predicted metal-dependent phosphoesterase TrpH
MKNAQNGLMVDFHVHTSHSKDSRADPSEVVDRALELGLDAIAVTDHNTVSGSLEAERIARGTGLLVIPGQEVRCREGEIMVLGFRKSLPVGMPAADLIDLARKGGGFIVIPHPFDLMRNGIGNSLASLAGRIDAVEAFNSRTIFNRFNSKAMSFAKDNGLPVTAGSDSHFVGEMGKAMVLVKSSRTVPAILRAVREGRTELVVSRQSLASGIRRGLLKIRTYFPARG